MSGDTTEIGWAILELMGHRRLAGLVTEQEIAGHGMLRIDIHGIEGDAITTQYYSPAALYALTPTTEDICRRLGETLRPEPVARYELEPARDPWAGDGYGGDDDDD